MFQQAIKMSTTSNNFKWRFYEHKSYQKQALPLAFGAKVSLSIFLSTLNKDFQDSCIRNDLIQFEFVQKLGRLFNNATNNLLDR